MFTHKHPKRNLTTVSIALAVLWGGAVEVQAQYSFGEPENLGPVVNSPYTQRQPSISSDGLTLFFDSDRPGGFGSYDLWMTTRASVSDPWQAPVNLGPTINSPDWDSTPNISSDGLTLFLYSERPGQLGTGDLWMASRASTVDPWQPPVNLGPVVNSAYYESMPSIAADGLTLYFRSGRPGSLGIMNLWMTTRISAEDPWQAPVELGPPVNTSWDESGPSISADGLTLFFNSGRPGGDGIADLWQVAVTPTCVDRNGVCDPGEDCLTCPPDCLAGASQGCGNGVCESSLDEDCLSCLADCNGKQSGKPADRFCCGDGAGQNAVGCDDPRCTSGGFDCSFQPVPTTCCGDGSCEETEDGVNCGVDCSAGCVGPADCDDADPCTIDDCVGTVCVNNPIDCDDGDACTADACSGGACLHDAIDCDDGDTCTTDSCDPVTGCENTFPACGGADGCCGPACNPGNDPDCAACGAKNDPCSVDEDCCSLNCRPNGRCRG